MALARFVASNTPSALLIGPRLIVNSATRWIALSWRAASPAGAQVCQYVVATISPATRITAATATLVICGFTSQAGGVGSIGHEQEPCEHQEVGDDARAPVRDEG